MTRVSGFLAGKQGVDEARDAVYKKIGTKFLSDIQIKQSLFGYQK